MRWPFRSRKIVVASQLAVRHDEQHDRWEIIFWLGDAFDYTIPFRATLSRIVDLLGGPDTAEIDLPPYEEKEDFVEGTLRFDTKLLSIYYEHSLGFLSLYGPDRAPLDEIAKRVSPNVKVALV